MQLPDYIKDRSDAYAQLKLGKAGWKCFITDGDGNALVLVGNGVVWCDSNGRIIQVIKADTSQQLSLLPFMLKESLLPHHMLRCRYDVENLEPPFFASLTSSEATLR